MKEVIEKYEKLENKIKEKELSKPQLQDKEAFLEKENACISFYALIFAAAFIFDQIYPDNLTTIIIISFFVLLLNTYTLYNSKSMIHSFIEIEKDVDSEIDNIKKELAELENIIKSEDFELKDTEHSILSDKGKEIVEKYLYGLGK